MCRINYEAEIQVATKAIVAYKLVRKLRSGSYRSQYIARSRKKVDFNFDCAPYPPGLSLAYHLHKRTTSWLQNTLGLFAYTQRPMRIHPNFTLLECSIPTGARYIRDSDSLIRTETLIPQRELQ